MKTTQKRIIGAFKVLESLSSESFPLPVAYKFYKLKKLLMPHYDFQIEREKVLIEKHKPHALENGDLACDTKEETIEFSKELNELSRLEVTIENFKPEDIVMTGDMNFTLDEIDSLDGFVNFVEPSNVL